MFYLGQTLLLFPIPAQEAELSSHRFQTFENETEVEEQNKELNLTKTELQLQKTRVDELENENPISSMT